MFDWLRSMYESIVSALVPEERHAFREMYGAGVIHRVLKRYGVSSELNAFKGERHNLIIGEDGLVDLPLARCSRFPAAVRSKMAIIR